MPAMSSRRSGWPSPVVGACRVLATLLPRLSPFIPGLASPFRPTVRRRRPRWPTCARGRPGPQYEVEVTERKADSLSTSARSGRNLPISSTNGSTAPLRSASGRTASCDRRNDGGHFRALPTKNDHGAGGDAGLVQEALDVVRTLALQVRQVPHLGFHAPGVVLGPADQVLRGEVQDGGVVRTDPVDNDEARRPRKGLRKPALGERRAQEIVRRSSSRASGARRSNWVRRRGA